MSKPVVLIVDDEKNTREGLARALRRSYKVLLADSGVKALDLLSEQPADVVLSDVRMPAMDGIALMKRIRARTPQPVCILLTAYGTVELAVEAMKQGAYDFLMKPVNLDQLDLILKRALTSRDLEQQNRQLHEQLDKKYGMEHIIGSSPPMQDIFDTIRQVAPSRATVLIQGESGTGKELVAHAIHQLSPRSQSPMIAVHCAALSDTLLESELFGHEKGAFTGASEQRRGRFEMADGGTLFLDEIGEIDLATQVKILRVLEERTFERVGGEKTIEVDVRLVTATNKNLQAMVKAGTFREDLYYRLKVIVVDLPPLRERKSDIPLLMDTFLTQLAAENERTLQGITPEVVTTLQAYNWPGNIRELRNVMERMVVMAKGTRLTCRDIPGDIKVETGTDFNPSRSHLSLGEAEQQMIVNALKTNQGNRTRAAKQLGISRRTLHRKLNEYGLREPGETGD